uniref:Uncharacterized protein n=1 Tax=Rhizophora mucronata TaxID=61149 RepID=A0A2P2QW05_RHIMU
MISYMINVSVISKKLLMNC